MQNISCPLVFSVCIGLLVGCSSRGPTATESTNTLIYSRGEDANTLDPIHTDIGEAVKVIVNIYDTLVTYDDKTTELVPGLAERWESSDDAKQWTFHLRKGVEFQDGTPLNADAVVYTFDRLLADTHPDVHEPGRPYQSHFKVIEKVEALDEHTVRFTLKTPSVVFLQNLAMFPASIVSPTAVKKFANAYAANPVGTGPFKLEKWNRDRQLVLSAFDKHWRGKAGVEHVVFLPVREGATRLEQVKRGEAHIADDLRPAQVDLLGNLPDLRVQETEGLNVCYLAMQTQKPPLNNVLVRKAIAMAIDKEELVKVVFAGHAWPAKSLVPPAMWGYYKELVDHSFELEKAKQLLAESGEPVPLKLTLSVMSQSRPYIQQPLEAASFIKDALAKIGIEVTIQQRDVNQHFTYCSAGKHELALAGWQSDNSDPDNFLYSLLDSDNISEVGNNLSRFDNPRLHELLKGAQSELDQEKRLAMYREAQELALQEVPVVPLVNSKIRVVSRANVQDWSPHPTGLVRLRTAKLE